MYYIFKGILLTSSRLFYAGACEKQMPEVLTMIQIDRISKFIIQIDHTIEVTNIELYYEKKDLSFKTKNWEIGFHFSKKKVC